MLDQEDLALLDGLDGELDGSLLGALLLGSPGDGLGLVDLHAKQGLGDGGRKVVGGHGNHAALAGDALGALDVLDVDGDEVLALDAALDVLDGGVIAHEHVDLGVDLALGDLRRRHLDGDGVIAGELGGGTKGELDGARRARRDVVPAASGEGWPRPCCSRLPSGGRCRAR